MSKRDPFAGSLVHTVPAPSVVDIEAARRLPFSAQDEARIASVALWCKIIGGGSLCSGSIDFIVNTLHLGFSLIAILILTFYGLVGLFLLQAGGALAKLAATDEADKHYLISGCQYLTKYFNLMGLLMVFLVTGLGAATLWIIYVLT